MRLSLVIVNWNGRDWLGDCLASVAEATAGTEAEGLVVDNATTDSSVEYMAEHHPEVAIIRNPENNGFGPGAQLGVSAARGEYIAVSNSDVAFTPGSLTGLVAFLDEHPRAAWAGPKITGRSGRIQSQALQLAGMLQPLRYVPGVSRLLPPRAAKTHDHAIRCEKLYGACMVFRAPMLREIGGMPTGSFLGGEEQILGARFKAKGYEVWYVPEYSVLHDQSSGRKRRWPHDAGMAEMHKGSSLSMRETLNRAEFAAFQAAYIVFVLLWFVRGLFRRKFRLRATLTVIRNAVRDALFRT